MNLPKPPSRNHYIPEFLLRRWIGDDGRFTRFKRVPGGKLDKKRATPSEIGFERDLYTMSNQPRKYAYQIEEGLLSRIDDKAGKLAASMLSGNMACSAVDRSDWSRFLMRLVHMKPYDIDTKTESYKLLFPHMFPGLGDIDPTEARNLVLRHAWTSLNSEVIGGTLVRMQWDILDLSRSNLHLIISDAPMILSNGLEEPDGNWSLPLSPTRLFVASWAGPGRDLLFLEKPRDIVRRCNRYVAERARIFVVSQDDTQEDFIRATFARQNIPTPLEQIKQRYETGEFDYLDGSPRPQIAP